jgi:hypothetical protein
MVAAHRPRPGLCSRPGPVVAAAAGTVVSVGTGGAYGNMVSLRHAGSITTRYAHLASIDRKIRAGAVVAIGQALGVEGATGEATTGLHLHFQVEINGKPVDPVPFMTDRGAPLNGTAVPPSSKTPSDDSIHFRGDVPEGGLRFPLPPPGRPRRPPMSPPGRSGLGRRRRHAGPAVYTRLSPARRCPCWNMRKSARPPQLRCPGCAWPGRRRTVAY